MTLFLLSGLILSAAVSPSNKVIDEAYDIAALDKYVDYMSVMTYDYHGQWDKMTGHVAPMYQHSQDDNKYFNTVSTGLNRYDKLCDFINHKTSELHCSLLVKRRPEIQ